MARILIVDDEKNVANTIDRLLQSRGHETIVAHNGYDALAAARREKIDIAILDVMMPGMTGIEVCKRLRANPDTATLPIIFLTAKVMLDDKIEGFEAGADDYLTKPFDIQELDLRVRAILRRTQFDSTLPGEQEESGVLVTGRLTLNQHTFEVTTPEQTCLLTPIEFELLRHLMLHPGEVFSSERLLQEVWDYPEGTGDPALVRMHIRNLRAKIEPPGMEDPIYIQTISRHGYTIRQE